MTANSKTIYVDLDDVLCETARHFLAVVEREFAKRIAYEDLTDFDIGTSCGLAPEETEELYRIVHRPDELMRIAPIEAAIAALGQWANDGYEIAIVTGRPPDSYEPSLAWLARYRVPHQSFSMVDKYSRFSTENTVAIRLDELAQRDVLLGGGRLPADGAVSRYSDEASRGADRLPVESRRRRSRQCWPLR